MTVFKTFTKWSWSQLACYRECPYKARLRYLEHSPEPPHESGDPRDRGIKVHSDAEAYVMKGGVLTPELTKIEGLMEGLRSQHETAPDSVVMETDVYLDSNWNVTDAAGRWLKYIPDAHVVTPELNLTIDFKTGRKYGNEVKHFQQMELYAIGAWINDPGYDEYKAELWYVDQKDVTEHVFTPERLEVARARLDKEVAHMMADKIHAPRPNKSVCRYCPFGPRGTGVCPVGVV